MLWGQSSHRGLTIEVLKDLKRAAADSLAISRDDIQLHFSGEHIADSYLNGILEGLERYALSDATAGKRTVQVELEKLENSINKMPLDSLRNSIYVRQLTMSVRFLDQNVQYEWQGKISDMLTIAQVRRLFEEDFPIRISGDYEADRPAILTVLLTTLGVFTLVAALYFMRT